MPSTINILKPFDTIHIGPFISQYSDWIIFTLFLFLFWAIAGIALRKRFEESRYLRVLITTVALLLAMGTYFSIYQGWLHLSLEGFGLFGAILILITVFFIIFGLMRGYGLHLANALAIGFVLFYISLWAISPNILHTLDNIFPLGNTILALFFLVSIFKVIAAFFRHSSRTPAQTAKELQNFDKASIEDKEIDREIDEDKKEGKMLKGKTIRFTKIEIKSIENIEACLKKIIEAIKERGNSLSHEDVSELTQYLKQITKNEGVLKKSLWLIKKHLNAYQSMHRKDIPELKNRLQKTNSQKQQAAIKKEIIYQKKMLEIIDFLESYEAKIIWFTDRFNQLIGAAMQRLKNHYPNDALAFLMQADKELSGMRQIFEKQKEFEKFLLKLNKKNLSNLKKEKDPK